MEKLFLNGTPETWKLCRLYLPHALETAAWRDTEEYKDKGPSLLEHTGRFYWEQGRSDEAEKLQVEVLDLRKEVLGPKHPDTILAMANLVEIQRQSADSGQGVRLEVAPSSWTLCKKTKFQRFTTGLKDGEGSTVEDLKNLHALFSNVHFAIQSVRQKCILLYISIPAMFLQLLHIIHFRKGGWKFSL